MTTQAMLAAAISFFALGATTFATVVLLLFAPRNLEVRAMALFGLAIAGWLIGNGMELITSQGQLWHTVSLVSVTLLPALFITMTAGDDASRLARYAGRVAIPCAIVLALVMGALPDAVSRSNIATRIATLWQIGGWSTGAVLMLRNTRPRQRQEQPLFARGLLYFLAIAAPLSMTVALLFDIDSLLVYALPLLVVTIYFGLFVGIARLRYYDIEVRALRSGEIAASAAEATRLAALGEMAASFAHEVRNPLTGVRSLTQRLAEEDIDNEKRARYTGVILDEMNRIERIVDNMLGVARRTPFAAVSSTIDLDSLFRDIVLLTASRARRAGVEVDAMADGLTVETSQEALAQALLNLTLNAIAHSPAAGRVRLTAESTADTTSIRVSDEGPGVPPAERERVFEPFYSSRPDGTGLGLSVVRTLARQAGWTVDIDDAKEGGAVFRITIPSPVEDVASSVLPQEAAP